MKTNKTKYRETNAKKSHKHKHKHTAIYSNSKTSFIHSTQQTIYSLLFHFKQSKTLKKEKNVKTHTLLIQEHTKQNTKKNEKTHKPTQKTKENKNYHNSIHSFSHSC